MANDIPIAARAPPLEVTKRIPRIFWIGGVVGAVMVLALVCGGVGIGVSIGRNMKAADAPGGAVGTTAVTAAAKDIAGKWVNHEFGVLWEFKADGRGSGGPDVVPFEWHVDKNGLCNIDRQGFREKYKVSVEGDKLILTGRNDFSVVYRRFTAADANEILKQEKAAADMKANEAKAQAAFWEKFRADGAAADKAAVDQKVKLKASKDG
jgi:hypothetical protein